MIPSITNISERANIKDSIAIFDIDDTLLYSKSKIYVKVPGKDWVGVPTDKFAEEREHYPEGTEYDYKDFREYGRVLASITGGKPNVKVLKELDNAIQKGWKIGIITARGSQKAIWDGLSSFLLYRNKDGELVPLPKSQFNKSYVFAVNDSDTIKGLGLSASVKDPSEAKAYIMQKIFGDKMKFSNIYFYDDDQGNISAVNDLGDSRIHAIKV